MGASSCGNGHHYKLFTKHHIRINKPSRCGNSFFPIGNCPIQKSFMFLTLGVQSGYHGSQKGNYMSVKAETEGAKIVPRKVTWGGL